MAKAEAKRPDGVEAAAIVTPNHMHAGPTYAFLKAGVHVVWDKPKGVAGRSEEDEGHRREVGAHVRPHPHLRRLPLVRRMREMVRVGELGEVCLAQVEYPQDWLTGPTETTSNK
jgi:predicted dehydrogenase